MTYLPVALVLVSALLHAYWNLNVKRSRDKIAFSYLYVWSAVVLYTPVFFLMVRGSSIPWQGWVCILSTGSVYCFYFLLLATSYSSGDLSLAYPIARGVAPMLTLLWAVAFLGERLSLVGYLGIASVIVSVFLLHPAIAGGHILRGRLGGLWQRSSLAALGTGLSISLYSVVDKVGVSFVDPALYIYLTFLVAGLLLSPYYLHQVGVLRLRAGIATEWHRALLVGFLAIMAYLLVLSAMRLTQVSYIIPLRSVSILFAVFLGFEALQESRTPTKILAALVMTAGVLLITLAH